MKRRIFFGAVTAILTSSLAVRAQSPTKKARAGVPIHTTPGSPTLALNLNNNSWVGGWDAPGQIYDMEFATGFTHTSGRQLEFTTSNHNRAPGNNTGVRWAQFHSTGAPWQGYYWTNSDTHIWETDNFGTFYLPWKQWVIAQHIKIINIGGTPSAVKRWPSATAAQTAYSTLTILDMSDVIDYVNPTGQDAYWYESTNPACDLNPPSNTDFTFSYGGGYFNSYPNGLLTAVRIVDNNPNYPATSTKPLRMRIVTDSATVSPTHLHGGVRVGSYFYWGGSNVLNDGTGQDANLIKNAMHRFYRIKLSDLKNGIITQDRLTDIPVQPSANFGVSEFAGAWKYGLFCADTIRKRVIYISGQGVFVYTIPAEETQLTGTWNGPYTFGMTTAQWTNTISDGHGNLTGNPAGFIGTHRSDLNKTFFRYNRSKKWHRIAWPN